MSPSDTVLLQEWRMKRDPGAFAEIVSRHAGMVFATCNRILGNRDDAREVAQECFVELMRTTRAVRSSVAAWLHVMAAHRALDRVKAEKRRRARELEYAAAQPASDEIKTDELVSLVDEAIGQLSEELGTPLILRFLEGHTIPEVASMLGTTEPTVRYRVDKAVEEVRDHLRKRGIAVAGASLLAFLTGQLAEAAPAGLVATLGKLAVGGAGFGAAATRLSLPLLIKAGVAVLGALTVVAGGWFYASHQRDDRSTSVAAKSDTSPPLVNLARATASGAAVQASGVTTETARSDSRESTAPGTGFAIPEDWQHAAFGRVYDVDSGEGIPGVKVHVSPNGGGRLQRSEEPTDADGWYVVTGLAEGSFTVRPDEIPDYPHTWEDLSFSVPREDKTPLDFALKRGVCVAGHVVDTSGKPVLNAKVLGKLEIEANPRSARPTDENGQFALYLVQPGPGLLLLASTDTATSGMVKLDELPAAGLDGVELRLNIPKSCRVQGIVRDASGTPQAKMNMHIYPPGLVAFGQGTNCTTGRDGRFSTEGLPPGAYDITVTPPGVYGFSSADVVERIELTAGKTLSGLDIVYGLTAGLSISGLVTDTSGKPIAKAQVQSYGKNGCQSAYTNEKGEFTLNGVDEGSCSIEANHTDYTPSFAEAQAGETKVVIVLKGRGAIEGRVIAADTGQPLQAFRVGIIDGAYPEFQNVLMANVRDFSDPQGKFAIGNVHCMGGATIVAAAPGYAPSWMEILPAENQTLSGIELRLERVAPIHGVVLGPDGKPVEGAFILLGPYSADNTIENYAAARTGADGRFTLDSVHPSVTAIGAWHGSYAAATAPLPPVARRGQEEVTIRLPQPATMSGHVTLNSVPVPETSVWANCSSDQGLPSQYVETGPDGGFRITGLAPGTVTIGSTSRAADLQISREVVIEAGKTVEVNLDFVTGSSTVFGKIGVADERMGLSVEAATPSGTLYRRVTPDADGTFRFEQLPACSGKLTLYLYDRQTYDKQTGALNGQLEYDFTVGDGQALEMNLEI